MPPHIHDINKCIPVAMKKSVFPILILCLFLWRPDISLTGAKNGLTLWAGVILPTLLPFMICSGAIVSFGGISLFTKPFRPILHGILGFSQEGSYVFLSGLLCGYPMGAKNCRDFLSYGMISPEEGNYLLAVSNHPSPMFLLGYAMAGLDTVCSPAIFLTAIYLPILPVALLASHFYGYTKKPSWNINSQPDPGTFSFDKAFMQGLEAMVKIGGYIMAFSILACYIQAISPLSPKLNACILGITELTTGIHSLELWLSGPFMAAAVAFAASFGGFSGIFQTKSVLTSSQAQKNAGLSIRHYVLWKLLHASLSCLIMMVLLAFRWKIPG